MSLRRSWSEDQPIREIDASGVTPTALLDMVELDHVEALLGIRQVWTPSWWSASNGWAAIPPGDDYHARPP
jgi:hypothetical protein